MHKNSYFIFAALFSATPCAIVSTAHAAPLADWPRISGAVRPDARLEARVTVIVGAMTLAQKVGQTTQGEIKSVTPDDVREIALPALRHRIALAPELQIEGQSPDDVLKALLAKVSAPRQ